MDIVRILIAADCVHIGIQSFPNGKSVSFQCMAFPFCQRMYNLYNTVILFADSERNRALHAIQIIVQSRFRCYE